MNKQKMELLTSLLLLICCPLLFGGFVDGNTVTFHIVNKCPFPVWPAAAPNSGHPVIANDGGFFLPSGEMKHVKAPLDWSGRFWARTGCGFTSGLIPACQTGDCQGQLSCNGAIGQPPATLVEVSLQPDLSKPSFYDVSLVDGYNVPVSVSSKPANPNCSINGCKRSVNNVCPPELQVQDQNGMVVACKSACLAFDLDLFCCRNAYGTPAKCKPTTYSELFKNACPSYFSYAYDSPSPLVTCASREYVITFCPAKWSQAQTM